MDGLNLLAKIKILLDFIHLLTNLHTDLVLHLHDFKLVGQHTVEFFKPGLHINAGQQLLPG